MNDNDSYDNNIYDRDIRENEGILYLVMAGFAMILAVIVLMAGAA